MNALLSRDGTLLWRSDRSCHPCHTGVQPHSNAAQALIASLIRPKQHRAAQAVRGRDRHGAMGGCVRGTRGVSGVRVPPNGFSFTKWGDLPKAPLCVALAVRPKRSHPVHLGECVNRSSHFLTIDQRIDLRIRLLRASKMSRGISRPWKVEGF